jgi:hypothetical protein
MEESDGELACGVFFLGPLSHRAAAPKGKSGATRTLRTWNLMAARTRSIKNRRREMDYDGPL